jgi:hypothetical protein
MNSKAKKIRAVKVAIEGKRRAGIRYLPPKTLAQLERIYVLRAYGPLSVRVIDIDLAQMGWVKVYDDTHGNESVDYTHPYSMEADEALEKAEQRLIRLRR